MDLRLVFLFLAAGSLARVTRAFLPNYAGIPLPETDYTLTEITVRGIVRAAARYFEESDPERYEPGDLTGLDPLTPSRLFKKHYGDCVYSTKFELAIKVILDENVRISDAYHHKAVWHFNGNLITKGNKKMVSIRKTLLKDLLKGDENAPDYDKARELSGQFLHMSQSFYSNTNWVEFNSLIGGDVDDIMTMAELGVIKPLSFKQSPTSVYMCQNCPGNTTSPDLLDCLENLRPYVYYLTSGFRDGQDMEKPAASPEGSEWGHCSHGGALDLSWNSVAWGGINKESSDAMLSPHHYLHEQAALVAIQATEDFFYGQEYSLFTLIGEQKFRLLLNLDVGTSMTFVVDDTGSMSDDIEAVKEETIRIVKLHAGTCLAASKYVVVPFNDPEFGPALVTADANECIYFLGNLTAHGGQDCPENAISGLELGVQNSLNGAKVYLFTDADDKDREKLPDVLALITEKEVEVTFFITGECGGGRKRRDVRSLAISSSYDIIASSSGGEIYSTDKAGIKDLTKIIEGDIRASEVTITKRSALNEESLIVDIAVDSTTQEVLVSVVGNLIYNDTLLIANPEGDIGVPHDFAESVYTHSVDQSVFSINATRPEAKGNWALVLSRLDLFTEYRVVVSANSFLDFSVDFLEVNEIGMAFPSEGKLVAGAEVIIMVQASAPEYVASVTEIRLHDSAGAKTLLTVSAEPLAGLTEGVYRAQITIPEETFFVSIVGEDTESMEFLRTKPSEIQVVNFKLEQVPGTDTLDELVPGGVANVSFQLTNSGAYDIFTISLSVLEASVVSTSAFEPAISASVTPSSVALNTTESAQGLVTVTAHDSAAIGFSAMVTLTVTSGSSSALNFLSLEATVFEAQNDTEDDPDENDVTPPTCTVLDIGGGCTVSQMSQECDIHEWWVRFQAADDSIVAEISLDPEVGDNQSLEYEAFTINSTTAKYTTNCCCPTFTVTAKDGAGNTASCGKDYYSPVSDQLDRKPVCNGPNIRPDPNGLSTGVIAGIAVGSVVAAAVVLILVVYAAKSCLGSNKSVEPMMVAENTEPIPFKETQLSHGDGHNNLGKI